MVRAAAATDPGRVRTMNQDCALVSGELFAVTDGMGGHAGGEVAARLAIDTLEANFSADAGLDGLVRAVEAANAAVYAAAQADAELTGMGTTMTVAALVEQAGAPTLALANVGDSRAYLLDATGLHRLTEDHSVVEEMIRAGEITEAQAAVHPHRHIVTRVIGIDQTVEVDAWDLGAGLDGRLLLCSDGLTNECTEDEIAAVLGAGADPDATAAELVRRALDHGGSDNITVVVVDLGAGAAGRREAAPAAVARAVGAPRGATPARGTTIPPISPPISPPIGPESTPPTPPAKARARRSETAETSRRGERVSRPRLVWAREHALTFRTVSFAFALLVVLGGMFGFLNWYNQATYYVGTYHGDLAVFEGRPAGLLWYKPALVYRSDVPTSSILAADLPLLETGLLEPSYSSARDALTRLATEPSLLGAAVSDRTGA